MPSEKFKEGPAPESVPAHNEEFGKDKDLESALEKIPAADAVVVFGEWAEMKDGKVVPSLESKMRAVGALELFEKGKVKKIIVSGSGRFRGAPEGATIAEAMKEYLLSRGIPEDAIVTEGTSVNTGEGVEKVLGILKDEDIKTILLETSAYHLPRARKLFEIFLKKHGLPVELAGSVSAEELLKIRSPHYEKLVSRFEFPSSLKNAPKETLEKGLWELLRWPLLYVDPKERVVRRVAEMVRGSGEEQ